MIREYTSLVQMMETLVTTKMEGVKGDSAAEAAGELLRMRQSQAAASRESAGSDVGTVVSKAKRAASSLWLILHAQVRMLCNMISID